MKRLLFIMTMLLMANSCFTARSTFETRRAWVLDQDWLSGKEYRGPKHGMPFALMRLHDSKGSDPDSRRYTAQVLRDFDDDNYFEPIGVVRAVYMFWDRLTDEQRESIREGVQARRDWTRASGTANQRLMFLTNAYLLAQRFPDGEWHATKRDPAVGSAQLMAMAKDALIEEGRFRYHFGSEEFLSPNYLVYHVTALVNLYDFAEDPELGAVAEALLAYHLTHLALNVHGGYVMEPHARVKGPQYTGTAGSSNGTVQLNWLYWGQGVPGSPQVLAFQPLVQLALSGFRPWPLLERIANSTQPLSTRSTAPNLVYPPRRATGVNKRSVYRTAGYAVGTGAFKHVPDGHYLDRSHFGISWSSNDPLSFLQVGHPYWYADGLEWEHRKENNAPNSRPWWDAPASPFQQAAHHENTAIVLMQIPERDPWNGRGRADWYAHRDEQAQALRKNCMIRFPESVDRHDQHIVAGGADARWYFLKEGGVFIGIRTLVRATTRTLNPSRPPEERFLLIESFGGRCGFIFDVGTAADFPNSRDPYLDFRTALIRNDEQRGSVAFDPAAETFAVVYTNLAGVTLELEYVTDVTRDFPTVRVAGVPVKFETWPLIDTADSDPQDSDAVYVHMEGGLLDVRQGGERLTVDWTGPLPVVDVPRAPRAP